MSEFPIINDDYYYYRHRYNHHYYHNNKRFRHMLEHNVTILKMFQ